MSGPEARLRFDAIISGASFAGLACAVALVKELGPDLRLALIERGPWPAAARPDARAFALSAASCNMLSALGVWDRVSGLAEPVRRIEITDSELDAGIRPVILTYANLVDGDVPATHIVPATAVSEALAERVAREPGIAILSTATIASLEQGPHVASVTLADGRQLEAPLVIAAEGRQSALREMVGIKVIGWGYGQSGIVATVAHERPHEGTAVQHFLPAGPFAILPLPGNRSCVTWSEETGEAARIMALDDEGFLSELEHRLGGRLGRVSLAGPRQSWPLAVHLARAYIAPRLALVGDTAHGVHPIAGQGLNLALRDAAAIAEVVSDAARLGLDVGALSTLARYERWRRFDSVVSAATFDGLNRLFSSDNPLLRAFRSAGLGAVDRLPGLKRVFVSEAAGLTGEMPRLMRPQQAS